MYTVTFVSNINSKQMYHYYIATIVSTITYVDVLYL